MTKKSLEEFLDKVESQKLSKEIEVQAKLDQLSVYQKYIKITSPTGAICKDILTRMASNFSDGIFEYFISEYVYRNKPYLELSLKYNVNGTWIDFDSASDGQKIICGVHFLSKIFHKNGVLICDEHFRYLDEDMLMVAMDILKNMSINNLIISTHSHNFTYSTKRIHLELESGVQPPSTKYIIT